MPLRDGMDLVAKEYVASQIPIIPVCLFYHVSLERLRNAKKRSWSIHTILTALLPLLGRLFRCLWQSGANATTRCFERFYAMT